MTRAWIGIVLCITLTNAYGQQPQTVEVRKSPEGYRLFRGGEPYTILGAGGTGHYEVLAGCGGNSVRTWGTDQWEEAFSRAEALDLTICAGIWLDQERQGFDYSDADRVRQQFERIQQAVLRYKDHPALLLWGIGNELDLNYTNPAVWDAVEEVARFIREVDGRHPTMTVTAFIEKEEVEFIKEKCPSIDILGVNCYAALPALPAYIREFGWDGPYIVGEWGTFGHWEVEKTSWNEPIEFTSSQKADLYLNEYTAYIRDDPRCLGSYVFLWGTKQERTATWYSMFLPGGEKTEAVDVMQRLWKGAWPNNRSPRLVSLELEGKQAAANVILYPGQDVHAAVDVRDPDGDALDISWEVLHETTDKRSGGDAENRPPEAKGLHMRQEGTSLSFAAPRTSGPYRLYVYVLDNKGNGAHANIPFYIRKR